MAMVLSQSSNIGVFTYSNGDKFEGKWVDGQKQGKGKVE